MTGIGNQASPLIVDNWTDFVYALTNNIYPPPTSEEETPVALTTVYIKFADKNYNIS